MDTTVKSMNYSEVTLISYKNKPLFNLSFEIFLISGLVVSFEDQLLKVDLPNFVSLDKKLIEHLTQKIIINITKKEIHDKRRPFFISFPPSITYTVLYFI